ncbi:integrator complex subunit 12, partial [Olea europaea subsp. europaea]
MTTQFEASLLKAMQLLHSPSKDATDQLKAMLDGCLAQRKAPPTMPVPKQSITAIKPVVANKQPVPVHNPIIVPSDDIDLTGSSCAVCKQVDQKGGNEIVECQECHTLYHQECHDPRLENVNVRDPRFVWYCSTCTNRRKKIKLPAKQPATSSSSSATNKETKDPQTPE